MGAKYGTREEDPELGLGHIPMEKDSSRMLQNVYEQTGWTLRQELRTWTGTVRTEYIFFSRTSIWLQERAKQYGSFDQ